MARDQALHDGFKAHCREAVQLLAGAVKDGSAPRRLTNKIEITAQGMSHGYVEEVDWLRLALQKGKEIRGLSSYGVAIEAMKGNEKVAAHLDKLVGTTESRIRVDAESCLRSVVIETVKRYSAAEGGGESLERVFEALYPEIEAYFYSTSVRHRFLAVVEGLSMESDRIDLGDGSAIVQLGKEEREKLLACGYEFGAFSQAGPFATMQYGIEIVSDVAKVTGDEKAGDGKKSSMDEAKERIEDVCSGLRLFKKGNFGFNSVRMESVGWSAQGGTMVSGSLESKSFVGSGYSLTGTEEPQFRGWWQEYRESRATVRRGIDLALRRFNLGYERGRLEDRLIDYFIGFEALLLKEQERQELDYRLALRGAALLGKDGPGRTRVFQELRAGYRARSKIVHGALPQGRVRVGTDEVPFGDFVGKVEELLRLSIKECLVLCRTKTEGALIEELALRIVAGG